MSRTTGPPPPGRGRTCRWPLAGTSTFSEQLTSALIHVATRRTLAARIIDEAKAKKEQAPESRLLALGVAPGPRVGELLKQVYERQLDGEITTAEGAIEAGRALLRAQS
jgi:hypothetical protein